MKSKILLFCTMMLATAVLLLTSATPPPTAAAPMGGGGIAIYLPAIHKPTDLSISAFEATQAIQSASNSVPLVTNRATVLRVYTQTSSGDSVANTTVTLSASRGGTSLGSISAGPRTASGASSRANLSSTFNVLLPANWLSGSVLIQASTNNGGSFSRTFVFNTVPDLKVVIVPVNYTHTPSGQTFLGTRTDHISDWIMRAYPIDAINVSIRDEHLSFTGNLDSYPDVAPWVSLLNAVTSLKVLDTASESTVYYAYLPFSCGWFDCNGGGIAGIGWIGQRASVGIDFGTSAGDIEDTGILAAHEIGHNFGRLHAPCRVSEPDSDYPYAGASIGEYGLDIQGSVATLKTPTTHVDMMSYCQPEWLSDYTYVALYNDQRTNGAMELPPVEESLFIRATLNGGEWQMKPVYSFDKAPNASQNGNYMVELLDAAGNVLVAQPVWALVAEEHGLRAESIFATLPRPDAPVASIRIISAHSQAVVAQRTLNAAALAVTAPQLQLAEANTQATLNWAAPDVPAIVRYSADGGQSWEALAVDVLGGSLPVDLTTLPGGANGRFQILLADSSEAAALEVTLPVVLPDHAPTVWLTGPETAVAGAFALFYAQASDVEEGALQTFSWMVDGVPVEATNSLFLDNLAVGEHEITLTVVDGAGQTAVTTQTLVVQAAE